MYRLYKWGLANHLLHKFYASFDYLFETKNGQNDTRFITFCHYDKLLIQPETPETIFSYFKAFLNLSKRMQRKYEGQYIIMIDGKIVSHGKQIDTPLPTIKRKYPEKIPLITKIPRAEAMIL